MRCQIALARELGVPPDDLVVAPVLEMVEESPFYEEDGEKVSKIVPETPEQHDAIMSEFYPIILSKIFQGETPFEGFMETVMSERGII
jgi:hypothetical protein